ncbi:MAG: hypothetical protein AAB428_00445 [Patescibacteria group bacterium]
MQKLEINGGEETPHYLEREVIQTAATLQRLSARAKFPEHSMEEDQFTNELGSEMVSAARQGVSKTRQLYRGSENMGKGIIGTLAETIPLLGNTLGFFGKDRDGRDIEVKIYATAPSEDLGPPYADLIFEIKNVLPDDMGKKINPKSVTRFLVDVTTETIRAVEEKVDRAEENFKRGKLHDLRFFRPSGNPLAKVGVPNAPNLILSIDQEEMINFLREVRPYVDAERGAIINKEKFEARYHDFAEDLRETLYTQAIEQTITFVAIMDEQKIVSTNDCKMIEDLMTTHMIADAYKAIEGLIRKIENSNDLGQGNKNKTLSYLGSLKNLAEAALSLAIVAVRKNK